jgi:tRNA A37 threonylcarbamoyladenosine biosynthesis protein TsaE
MDAMYQSGALVMEWPEQIRAALPEAHLWVNLIWVDENQRRMVFLPKGEHYQKLISNFRQKTFGG